MLNTPKQRTVEFVRPTYVDGKVVPVGEKRTLGTGIAAELVTARKAKFADPDPVPVPTPQVPGNELPEDHPHVATAKSAMKGK
jgi:hypothetical protein